MKIDEIEELKLDDLESQLNNSNIFDFEKNFVDVFTQILWDQIEIKNRFIFEVFKTLRNEMLRSKLHKKYLVLIDFDKRDQWHERIEIVEIVKIVKLNKSISSTKSIFLIILCRSLLTIDNFLSSTINTIIEQTSFVLFWLLS